MPQITNARVRIAQSTLEYLLQALADAMSPFHSGILYLHSNIKENKANLIHTLLKSSFAFAACVAFLIKQEIHMNIMNL